MSGFAYKINNGNEMYREWWNRLKGGGAPGPDSSGPDSSGKDSDSKEESITPPWEWNREKELNDAWEAYNRGFSYNLNADPFYQQMVDRYTKSAQLGMEDTMGKAAALTGGYGNSYAVTAGQQAYYNQMDGLNDIAMSLYNNAYNQWRDSKNDALTKYSLLSEQKSDEDDDDDDTKKYDIGAEFNKIYPLLEQTLLDAGGGIEGYNKVADELQKYYDDETAEQLAAYFAFFGSQQGSK